MSSSSRNRHTDDEGFIEITAKDAQPYLSNDALTQLEADLSESAYNAYIVMHRRGAELSCSSRSGGVELSQTIDTILRTMDEKTELLRKTQNDRTELLRQMRNDMKELMGKLAAEDKELEKAKRDAKRVEKQMETLRQMDDENMKLERLGGPGEAKG
ncbi:hypothetical protein CC86DRAFT_411316 [Ophiobolus disseminans]|uniref:Uncharacterized protein n=1 Tax=Ophiobolus disseminans TaxID=1469910 RepID=A0A6A6ZJC9_9PLEO|nr:hypothetical protein CC86DRAFT_411316 [Ophiobolus disseminans]